MRKMEKRYLILKELKENNLFNKLVSSGVVSISVANKLMIYDKYLEELKENQKPVAIQFTSEYYKISVSNVYKIIAWME